MTTYDQFNASQITRSAPPEILARGRSYFYSGLATVIAASRFRAVVTVRGSDPSPYTVTVLWSAAGAEAACNCPFAAESARLICKHKVAAALAIEHYLRAHPRISWQSVLDEALSAAPKAPPKQTRQVVVFSLQQRYSSWGIYVYTLPPQQFDLEQIDDPQHIVRTVIDDQLSGKAKGSRSPIERSRIANASRAILAAAELCWTFQQSGYYSWSNSHSLHRIMPALRECPLFFGTEEHPLRSAVTVEEEIGSLQVEIERQESGGLKIEPIALLPGGIKVHLKRSKAQLVSDSPAWILYDDRIAQIEGAIGMIAPILRASELTVPEEEVPEFTARYLASLAARIPITGDGFQWTELIAKPIPRLYLKQDEIGGPAADLRFAYGDQDIVLGPNPERNETEIVHVSKDQAFVKVRRDLDVEADAEQTLARNGLRRDYRSGGYALKATTHVLAFLMHQIPHLIEAGFEIFGEENLVGARINRSMPKLTMHVSSGIDWFDVQMGVTFGDSATAPIKAIRQAIKKREKYIKLSDGSIGALPEEWVKKYSYLFSLAADHHDGETGEDGLRLQKHHAILLGDMLEEADQADADAQFRQMLVRLRDFSSIQPHPLPHSLETIVRPYQKHGFDWLHFLREFGSGGCIADDMGLGKTIQVLAFIESLRQSMAMPKRASLVVVPRSLIFNWQREAARFTPKLKILVHADLGRDRSTKAFDNNDIVLTTYGILVRDIEILKSHQFRCAILDESQAIKNPAALSAKASRLIKAEQRIVLTGTPVENSTQDLWSQFAFLNPGLLGTLEQFRSQFGAAIDRSQDEERSAALRRMVHPFILRRTKEQVAPELPPRTERILYTEMEPEQRKVYDETKQYYQAMLLGMIEREGMSKARMKVLEGLLRLRQIANHPRLVDRSYAGPSAKFDGLIETLQTLRDEGHKALIFSQFVQMLKIVQLEMNNLGLAHEMLTGQTKDRQGRVDAFQNNREIEFFLISLKAGGVGLNLTAADYVIHIDPWWNPAVEMQATDRTHRIGQDKPVFIYKLIARDTVEDKILQLQERKRAVVQQVITSESGFFKSLTRDDIAGLFG